MHPHEHVVLAGHRAPHHGDVLLAVEQRLVGVAGEVAPLGGDAGLGDATHELLVLAPVADEVGDRDHQQPVLVGEALQLGHPGHVRLLVVDDLAEQPGRVEARHAAEVDRGLGVAGPLEHAALAGHQRVDVTGTGQVTGTGGRVAQGLHGRAAVVGRDPGGGVVAVVDRDEEGRALALGVLHDHQRKVQLGGPLGGDRARTGSPTCGGGRRRCSPAWRTRRPGSGRPRSRGPRRRPRRGSRLGRRPPRRLRSSRTACQASFQESSRSTYLAVTSTSRFTRSPGPLWPRVVTSIVCGMTATVKLSSAASTTVRLMPSTVIEPFSTT